MRAYCGACEAAKCESGRLESPSDSAQQRSCDHFSALLCHFSAASLARNHELLQVSFALFTCSRLRLLCLSLCRRLRVETIPKACALASMDSPGDCSLSYIPLDLQTTIQRDRSIRSSTRPGASHRGHTSSASKDSARIRHESAQIIDSMRSSSQEDSLLSETFEELATPGQKFKQRYGSLSSRNLLQLAEEENARTVRPVTKRLPSRSSSSTSISSRLDSAALVQEDDASAAKDAEIAELKAKLAKLEAEKAQLAAKLSRVQAERQGTVVGKDEFAALQAQFAAQVGLRVLRAACRLILIVP